MAELARGAEFEAGPVAMSLDMEDIVYEVKEDEGMEECGGLDLLQENATKVWVPKEGDSESLWQLSSILTSSRDHNTTTVLIQDQESGALEAMTFSTDNIRWHDVSHDRDCKNVSEINDLNEPALLLLLKKRYERDCIYTLAGETLLSVNPNKVISTISDGFEPSLESMADLAYAALLKDEGSQAILINGESGAGKTEASKNILKRLMTKESDLKRPSRVNPLIKESNTVIEAFGNAKTSKNHNSSRFGKYTAVHYAKDSDGNYSMCKCQLCSI